MAFNKYLDLRVMIKLIEYGLLGFFAYYVSKNGTSISFGVVVAIYIGLFALFLFEFVALKIQTKNIDLLVRHFYEQNGFNPEADVRITLHKRLNKKFYKQYIDYYPSGGRKGRKHEIKKGIVRHAFTQETEHFSENFVDKEEKIRKLLEIYNFRKDEADQQIADGEMSYYCCPVVVNSKIWGVLYLNARVSFTFPKQEDLSGSLIESNTKALVKMIQHEIG